MKVKFITQDGHRLDEDGGRDFLTEEHAAREALRSLSDWLVDQRLNDLPGSYGVLGLDEQNTPLFRLQVAVDMERFSLLESLPIRSDS